MSTLLNIAVSLIASAVVFIGGMNLPANLFSLNLDKNNLGAFSEISTATNLADFPTTYNANLNKTIEVGTTSVASITTLSGLTTANALTSASALATIGTITTGTWNGTTIATARGGTGSTTLSSNQVLLGNGTGNIGIVSGYGTSGQFLTSNGAGSAPTWQTSAVDQAIPYNWTAHHTFTSLFATAASSTNATTTNQAVTGLGTAAGTLVAADPNGRLIATTTPSVGYVGAIVATTTSAAPSVTQDNTFTTGWQPSLMRINYRLQGRNSAGETVYQQGWVEYPGSTTATANYQLNVCPNTGANSAIDSTTWVLDTSNPACGRGDSHATDGVFAGLTVTSVTATGFTVRTTFTASNQSGGGAKYYVTAYR